MEDDVSPVFQRYVPLLPVALRLTDEVAQLNVALEGVMLTVGTLLAWKIVRLVVLEQPEDVTVTEYVPLALATAVPELAF
ncbi:hypothetical protein GCM10027592_21990 [Spirosoma flavus]